MRVITVATLIVPTIIALSGASWAQQSPAVDLAATAQAPAPTRAPDAPKSVESAERTLKAWFAGYEFVPTDRHFARLGQFLAPALVRVAELDPNPLFQARAVSAMVHAPGPATEAWLTARLQAADRPSLLLRKAALVLGESYGAKHLELFGAALGQASDDVPLREALARAMLLAGEESKTLRRWILRFEQAPTVRAILGAKHIGDLP